tara:strand:- start:74 stop:193 length:120 start_codon:yes stop_codon:yes gene_type:complete
MENNLIVSLFTPVDYVAVSGKATLPEMVVPNNNRTYLHF